MPAGPDKKAQVGRPSPEASTARSHEDPPAHLGHSDRILRLQASAGNRAVVKMLEGRNGGTKPPKAPVKVRGGSPSVRIQRVGGAKIGTELTVKEGVEDEAAKLFKVTVAKYKADVQKIKTDAAARFTGKEEEVTAQTEYTAALSGAEMKVEELVRRITSTRKLEVKARR